MKQIILHTAICSFFIIFTSTLALAKTTQPPTWGNVANATSTNTQQDWKYALPEDYWKGDEKKAWAQVPNASGKLIWVSFQNAPKRKVKNERCGKDDWHFSVSWRTDKDTHPGESDGKYGHVGIRCYGNVGQCPPAEGKAWSNVLMLINQPTPAIPKKHKPDMVYGDWLGSCN